MARLLSSVSGGDVEITELLRAWSAGSEEAAGEVFEELYDELRAVAANRLAGEARPVSIQVTELVHETYLKLARQDRVSWHNRVHFFAVSGQMMRRILVDHYRGRSSQKRGGFPIRLELADSELVASEPETDLVALHEALERLERAHPSAGRLVELRYFGGMTVEEAAAYLKIGRSTAVRRWQFARIWLKKALADQALAAAEANDEE